MVSSMIRYDEQICRYNTILIYDMPHPNILTGYLACYCNSVLAGLPVTTLEPLQRVQNAATRLVLNLSFRDHVKPALAKLHWLPVKFRIQYKLCLFMHHVHYISAPQYLSDAVQSVATASRNRRTGLRSADTANYVKRCTRTKFGERGFSFAGPAAWNNLPNDLQSCSNTNTDAFKKKLKTFFFQCAFETDWFYFVFFIISIYTYISSRVVSAPGHFCIVALYKFLLYCIVLYYDHYGTLRCI